MTVATDDSAELASTQLVSGTYFDGLGVPAALGRTLEPSDDRPGAEPAAVVSHRYWQHRFLGDPAIIGKTIRVNRAAVTIVGVTPDTFHGTEVTESVDLSLPLAMSEHVLPPDRPPTKSMWWLLLMGRLKPGVTREQVLAELQPIFKETVVASWSARPPETREPGRSGMPIMRVMSGSQGPNGTSHSARASLTFLFVVTGVVLLIACVNFVRTLYNYSRVDVGFDPRNLLVFQIDPTPSASDPESPVGLFERLITGIETVPGVRSVTMSAVPVVARSEWTETVRAETAGAPRKSTSSWSDGISSRRSACRSWPAGAFRQPTRARLRASR